MLARHSRVLLAALAPLAGAQEPPVPDTTFTDNVWIQKVSPSLVWNNTLSTPNRGFELGSNNIVLSLTQTPFTQGDRPDIQVWHKYAGYGNGLFLRAPLCVSQQGHCISPNSFLTLNLADPQVELRLGASTVGARLVMSGKTDTFLSISDAGTPAIGRNLVRLANNGPATFRFENSATGAIWGFGGLAAQDRFFISQNSSPGVALTLDASGNLTILGALTQVSDRNAKQDLRAVDGPQLLRRIAALPLSTWSYKADAGGARHIGPMAQDFQAAFGLGTDDTHLAPSDVAGLSLAGVQALQRENELLRARLERLERRLEDAGVR
jgi:hypothetical protein